MPKLTGKALVAQGGGPTAVINQSLAGVVQESKKFSEITHVYGSRNGVAGVIKEDFLDLSHATNENLEAVAQTPASSLGSTRDKPDEEYCEKIFKVLAAHDIRYFYYIGGNDSSDTCRLVSEHAEKNNYALRALHVPKTIDNDLVVTDHCPGYGSAAKFVAQAFAGINQDNAALPGVYIGVVMGRHAGFLTAASALGRINEDDGPHLIYTPEKVFKTKKFVNDVQSVYDKLGRCIVALSEGISDKDHNPIITTLIDTGGKDSHGNVQLSGFGALGDLLAQKIRDDTKIKRVRADTLGYLQRSFSGCVSQTDAREAREVGKRAVVFSTQQERNGSVSIKRIGNYGVDYELIDLADVAAKTKTMPDEFFASDTMITQKVIDYAQPLAGELPRIGSLNASSVEKIINK